MYKLLIADDDEIICQGLSRCIPWREHNIEIVSAVCDGETALKCVKEYHPDIALVDINMPFMDGMEFSAEAKKIFPELKIILITAYREFEYAKRAIELQVSDYVTKPFSNEHVLETVCRVIQKIEDEKRIKGEIQKNIKVIEEKYIAEAAAGKITDRNRTEIERLFPPQNQYSAAVLDIGTLPEGEESEEAVKEKREAIDRAVEKIREMVKIETKIKICRCQNQMIFLFTEPGVNGDIKIQVFLKKCMEQLSEEGALFLTAAIGRCYTGNQQISRSVAEAQKVLKYRYYFEQYSVLYVEDVEKLTVEEQINFQEYIENACAGIREGEPEKVKNAVKSFFERMQKQPDMRICAAALMVMEFLLLSYRETQDGELQEKFVKESTSFYPRMLQEKNIDGLRSITGKYFADLIQYLEEKKRSQPEKMLQRAVTYMEAHYDDPELSLNEVADFVHISASYLCTLFKQYSEYSYISCLNHIRMEQAKQILKDRKHKTYEVAFLVGYNSSQYFSSSFKKYTGMTPGEYRAKKGIK